MNNACCKPTMTMVCVRVAALGSRGLLLWQRQCKSIMGTKVSPLPLTTRSTLPHLHWPREAEPSQRSIRRPSLFTLQCSVQEPFPPATTFVLLNTKECADGSIMYNFGTAEQQSSDTQTEQPSRGVSNGVSSIALESIDSKDLQASANGTHEDTFRDGGLAGADIFSIGEDVPDSASLTDVAHDSEVFARELNEEEDEQKAESNSREGQLQPETLHKARVESNGSSNYATPSGSDGSDSSGLGIKDENQNPDVKFNSAAAMIPHPDKVQSGGEDAYFIDGTRWVGVADGVGGWALSGVNAGHYARELMWNCAERARKVGNSSDPKSVLVYAARRTNSQGTAATLVASLYGQTLRVANIGDSGFVVVRDSTVVARSEPMVRGFNFPYQIGTEGDDPEIAEVQKNDIVILGSDGIWDNLFDHQIIDIIASVQKAGGGPEVVAKQLVTMAQKVGLTKQGMSPFAVAAHSAGYGSYFGGKLDDTTAVVAYVT